MYNVFFPNNFISNNLVPNDFIYAVIHDGGFGLLKDRKNLKNLMLRIREIFVQKFTNPNIAYDFCRQNYVDQRLKMNIFDRPSLPSLEDVLSHPFFEKGYLKNIVFLKCFFATLSPTHVGIYDNVEESLDFIEHFNPCILKEFDDFDDALGYINATFLRYIYPHENEIDAPIKILKSLPLNVAVPVNFLPPSN